jgi:hypothetical protein
LVGVDDNETSFSSWFYQLQHKNRLLGRLVMEWKRLLVHETDCGDGVLHVPPTAVLIDQFINAKTMQEVSLLDLFVTNGINVSW